MAHRFCVAAQTRTLATRPACDSSRESTTPSDFSSLRVPATTVVVLLGAVVFHKLTAFEKVWFMEINRPSRDVNQMLVQPCESDALAADSREKACIRARGGSIAYAFAACIGTAHICAQAQTASASADVNACVKSVEEKTREFSPLYERVLTLNDKKTTAEMNKLRDEIKLERLKDRPPTMLVECNRMLSNLNAAIRFAREKTKP
jgi:hypothetical protein